MAKQYIFVNENGVELSRRDITRGRPPCQAADRTKLESGDVQCVVRAIVPVSKAKKPVTDPLAMEHVASAPVAVATETVAVDPNLATANLVTETPASEPEAVDTVETVEVASAPVSEVVSA